MEDPSLYQLKNVWLINERVSEIIRNLDSTDARIAKAIQLTTKGSYNISQVSSVTQNKKVANDVFLTYFLKALPFVSKYYLLLGEGEMYTRKITTEELEFFKSKYGTTSKTESNIDKDMCDRVKYLRKSLGKTQEDFSNSINVARSMICAIEGYRQNPTDGLKKMLRKILNVRYNWLIDGDGKIFENKNDEIKKFLVNCFKSWDTVEERDYTIEGNILTVSSRNSPDWEVYGNMCTSEELFESSDDMFVKYTFDLDKMEDVDSYNSKFKDRLINCGEMVGSKSSLNENANRVRELA
tara:strand:+ start:168 stop:1055 length:888 start_codon:yes stop_codon:yes gene_type:complete